MCLSTTVAKPIQTPSEKFECVANYLKDKKLLDKGFQYYNRSEPLECKDYIKENRDSFISNFFSSTDSSSEETDLEAIVSNELLKQREKCLKLVFDAMYFPELLMKISLYEKSTKTPKKVKKKLLSAANHDAEKKLDIAISVCFPEEYIGVEFDELIQPEDRSNYTLDDKQDNYCARKYIVDNKLIDTSVHPIVLNPDNLELNFDCTDKLEDLFEIYEEHIKESFETEGDQPRSQLRCFSRVIRNKNISQFMAKTALLAELKLTDKQKEEFRTDFVDKIKELYIEMIKCYM